MQALKCDRCGHLSEEAPKSDMIYRNRTDLWATPGEGFYTTLKVQRMSGGGKVELCAACFRAVAAQAVESVASPAVEPALPDPDDDNLF